MLAQFGSFTGAVRKAGLGLFVTVLLLVGFTLGVHSQTDDRQELILARIRPFLLNIQQQVPVSMTLTLPEGATEGQTVTVPLLLDLNLQIGVADTVTATVDTGQVTQPTTAIQELDQPKETATAAEMAVEAEGVAVTVFGVTRRRAFGPRGFDTPAAEGRIFLIVEVMLENLDREEFEYYDWDFSVRDVEGFEYEPFYDAPWPALKSALLHKGDKARGNLAFEVPDEADGFVLIIQPSGIKPIHVDLGR